MMKLLCLIGIALIPVLAFAGGAKEAPTPAAVAEPGLEAPQLAAMVARGELPPLAERLPENPLVVQPLHEAGRYGGRMQSALVGAADGAWLERTVGYEGMVKWNPGWSEVIPNYAERVEASTDGTTYTFHLRRGMRWSDGAPFTTADVEFWFNDIALNEDLSPVPSDIITADGEPAELTIIDDYTFRFRFAIPQGMFLEFAASNIDFAAPKHYLSQFHADFNPDAAAVADQEGYAEWMDYFDIMAGYWSNPDRPVLRAWQITVPYTGEHTRLTFTRNPYYWKVDPDGRQLPYIDEWVYDILENRDVLVLRTLAGDIDIMARHANTVENRPVLASGEAAGDFRLFEELPASPNEAVIYLNQTHNEMGELFRNRDFRAGLSHAIDREEIGDLLFAGAVVPWGAAPQAETPFHSERLAHEHIEYDVALANEYFDKVGLTGRDSAGYRLMPDGSRVIVRIDVHAPVLVDVLEIVQSHWREVGVRLEINFGERSFITVRRQQNQSEASIRGGTGGFDAIIAPRMYLPVAFDWAPRWTQWNYLRGGFVTHPIDASVEADEPPAAVREAALLHDAILKEPDANARNRMMNQILELAVEYLPTIGIVSNSPGYGIVHNRVRNFPEVSPSSWRIRSPAQNRWEQVWIDG